MRTKRETSDINKIIERRATFPIFIIIIAVVAAFKRLIISPMKWLLLLQLTATLALSPHPFLGKRLDARQSPLAFAGRLPKDEDNLENNEEWEPTPCDPEEARLTVIQITDVYTLETLASVKTLVEETKAKSKGSKVIAMMTGDFLAPYLLSSVDRGYGMMNALAKIPIDYICWGNHEADIPHKTVCRHVREFPGTWLNSNMLDHEAMESQEEFDVVEVTSPDGSNKRKVGLISVLSDDPALYSHFPEPGAFGGATITDPWGALTKYQTLLEGPDHSVDVCLPLQHLYVPDDHKTCREFDFPVILSGHDHHRVDEVVEGTRLLKPGMDAIYATVLEITWPSADAVGKKPNIKATFVKTADWEQDPVLAEENERAYDALSPLRNTQLAVVPPVFEPLSSVDARGRVCTMGQYICTLLRSTLNSSRKEGDHSVDAVALMGGNIRGGNDYEEGSFFSLEALEAEIKPEEVIGVVLMPGHILAKGIAETHGGDPIPGWMQYDIGIQQEMTDDGPQVTQVRGMPIDPDRFYRVGTKVSDLTNGQCPTWTEFYTAHPELLPPSGSYVNIHAELMSYFARILWRAIWEGISREICPADIEVGECDAEDPIAKLKFLDVDNDGMVSVEEIHGALNNVLGLSVDDEEFKLARFVHSYADTNGNGRVTLRDFKLFAEEMGNVYERDRWRQSLPLREVPPELTSVGTTSDDDDDDDDEEISIAIHGINGTDDSAKEKISA